MGNDHDMARYEYKVVAAPRRTKSFKGVRSHEDQFAEVLAEVMNKMAANDWVYLRAESLPCEEKTGLTSRVESYQSVLVFRRKIVDEKKFFEVPPTRQIELHEVTEDRVERDTLVFGSQRNRGSQIEEPYRPSTNVSAEGGALGILKNRKARLKAVEQDAYSEHMHQAAE